jgi:hypothetical protein
MNTYCFFQQATQQNIADNLFLNFYSKKKYFHLSLYSTP